MPVTIPGLVGALMPNLLSTGHLGLDTPKLATGIATGVATWIPQIVIQTVDSGSLGAGKGVPIPLVVPQPALYGALVAGDAAFGLLGILTPLMTLGIANGLVLGFAQMLLNTVHAGIGVGAGVATFRAPPAGPVMVAGFQASGMNGEDAVKKANAIGMGLDTTFASLVLPVSIVGSASPAGGASTGVGNII